MNLRQHTPSELSSELMPTIENSCFKETQTSKLLMVITAQLGVNEFQQGLTINYLYLNM